MRNADPGCVVTDFGCVVTDHWMGRFRQLEAHISAEKKRGFAEAVSGDMTLFCQKLCYFHEPSL
jgi:hypothetical protein